MMLRKDAVKVFYFEEQDSNYKSYFIINILIK